MLVLCLKLKRKKQIKDEEGGEDMAEREYIEFITKVQGEENLKQLGGIFEEIMEEAKKAGINVDKFIEKLKEMANQPKKDLPIYDQFISKLKTIAGVTAIGMGMKKSIDLFTSFDDVVRKVQATTGATAETMELLRYQAKQLGDSTSWSASEAAEAQFEFAKAGFTNNEILAATPGILDTATAAEMGLAEATEITAGALRMFNLDASKSTTVGDMLSKTASSTTTGVRDLAESLKYSGSGAKQFGLNLQQTLGILGKLGDKSLKGSSAGTALQAVFSTIQNKSKAQMLVDIGVNLTQDGKYRNILDIIDDIREKTSQMEKAQAESFINQVFQEQGSQAMNRLLDIPKEDLNALIKEIGNSQGFAKDLANTLNGGVGGAFRNMGSAIEGLGISLGTYLEPSMLSLINGVTEIIRVGVGFVDWLNSGSYMADTTSFAITSLCVGYGTYKAYLIATTLWEKAHKTEIYKKIAAFKLSSVVTAITAGAHKLYSFVLAILRGQVTMTTISIWGLNAAMAIMTAPIGLIIAGIVGAGAGFAFLYQKSKRFRDSINPLINLLKELWNWVKKFTGVGDAINAVKAGIGKVKDFFTAGTQGKTDEQKQKEIDDIINQVQTGSGNSQEVNAGAGVNTDYLITGGGSENNYRHNGYYLKGSTVVNNSSSDVSSSVYSEYSSTENKVPEKTMEEKILDTLLSIKDLLSNKNADNSKIQINISKNDKEEIISQVVEDLAIAMGNM